MTRFTLARRALQHRYLREQIDAQDTIRLGSIASRISRDCSA
jgi:hypothetical protein